MSEWESVTPRRDASFFGWGNKEGQSLTGTVLEVGTGNDINDNRVPELTIELTEESSSFVKGEWTTFPVGTVVILTCGQANLKKNVNAANLNAGDDVKITLDSFFPTAKGKAKIFDLKLRRNANPQVLTSAAPAQSSFSGGGFDSEAPF